MSGTRKHSSDRTASRMLTYEKNLYEDLGSLYAQGSEEGAADWARRRNWMLKRANLNGGMINFVIKTYYKSFILPEDEPEAYGNRNDGILIQQGRLKYGHKLTQKDLDGWFREEERQTVSRAALTPIPEISTEGPQPSKRSMLPLPKKPATQMCCALRPISEESERLGSHGRKLKAKDITFEAGRHDLPEMYQHLVADLDMEPDVPKVSVTAIVVERSAALPMPLLVADDWQKEATTVLRVLVRMIERKLATLQTAPKTLDMESLSSFRNMPPRLY
ncbi:hypothetical protein PGQ11_006852 [Apiospora arundinis]|uniref:Uncharacterized protein n=1 Tax=Apiospora arundinis TaxID=335852 RepID=A0ABR2ITW9_9PEZI